MLSSQSISRGIGISAVIIRSERKRTVNDPSSTDVTTPSENGLRK